MSVDEATKDAIKQELLKGQPLMDVEKIRKKFLDWLALLPLPDKLEHKSWEDILHVYPIQEGEERLWQGVRLRMTLPLHTRNHSYMLSLMESLSPDGRGVYILSTHVNWDSHERRLQENVEENYLGQFDDLLRAKHTIWVETIHHDDIAAGLNSCIMAILGHELVERPDKEKLGEPFKPPIQQVIDLPEAYGPNKPTDEDESGTESVPKILD